MMLAINFACRMGAMLCGVIICGVALFGEVRHGLLPGASANIVAFLLGAASIARGMRADGAEKPHDPR